jgi:hypothetical protein
VKSGLLHPEYRASVLGKANYTRPVLDQAYISPDSHFKIHYTLTGSDAVNPADLNANSIPDYVDEAAWAAEYSYRLLVDTLGFAPPPPDDNIDGPEIDLYIRNWNGQYYGMTYPENEVPATPMEYDYTAYTVVDNDYQELVYYTRGLNGLHVTVAHEFFHIVQLGYNWRPSNGLPGIRTGDGDRYFLEWSAVWFEERSFPQTDDYYQYFFQFFYYPTKSLWYSNYDYALGLFLIYLTRQYGDAIVPEVWEGIKTTHALASLESVLEQHDAELATVWNRFYRSCYYTGYRFVAELAPVPEAADFPTLRFQHGSEFTLQDQTKFTNNCEPFSTNPVKFTISRPMYIGVEKPGQNYPDLLLSGILDKYSTRDVLMDLDVSNDFLIGEAGSVDTLILFLTNTSQSDTYDFSLTVAEFPEPVLPSEFLTLYPNPCDVSNTCDLQLKVFIGKPVAEICFQIYDLLGRELYKHSISQFFEVGEYRVSLPLRALAEINLASGIYFCTLDVDGRRVHRPFTVLK